MIVSDVCKSCDERCCLKCKKHLPKLGCMLEYEKRPPTCQLYPFVCQRGELYLSLECPYWSVFGELELEARALIKEGG